MKDRKLRSLCHHVVAVLILGLMAFVTPLSPASAKELKLAHFLPPVHTNHSKVMVPWAKEVGKLSNGELTIKVYPARQLGGTPPGQFKMVVGGVADIAFVVPPYTPGIFPRTSVLEMPVPPKDSQHATRILYALFDKYLAEDFKAVKVLAMWAVDEYVLVTKDKPVRSLEDMKGLKFRAASRTQNLVIKALGGVPVNMPTTQVYTSMDTGVIDGMLGGASIVFSFRLMDVSKYYHFGGPFSTSSLALAMNKKIWNGLSPKHRKIIEETSQIGLGMKAAKAYDTKYQATIGAIKKARQGAHQIVCG
jgi:TRAP-type C4-dicarboxylate transport system substrate-binding protein